VALLWYHRDRGERNDKTTRLSSTHSALHFSSSLPRPGLTGGDATESTILLILPILVGLLTPGGLRPLPNHPDFLFPLPSAFSRESSETFLRDPSEAFRRLVRLGFLLLSFYDCPGGAEGVTLLSLLPMKLLLPMLPPRLAPPGLPLMLPSMDIESAVEGLQLLLTVTTPLPTLTSFSPPAP
jgi:hypothetical protein